MNVNKVIAVISAACVVISGAAAAVSIKYRQEKNEITDTLDVLMVEKENEEYVRKILNGLSKNADISEKYEHYKEYYDAVDAPTEDIKKLRDELGEAIDELSAAADKCREEINKVSVEMKPGSPEQIQAAEELKDAQCFKDVKAALNKCHKTKAALSEALEEYKKKQSEPTPRPVQPTSQPSQQQPQQQQPQPQRQQPQQQQRQQQPQRQPQQPVQPAKPAQPQQPAQPAQPQQPAQPAPQQPAQPAPRSMPNDWYN